MSVPCVSNGQTALTSQEDIAISIGFQGIVNSDSQLPTSLPTQINGWEITATFASMRSIIP